MKDERRRTPRKEVPTKDEVRAVFHRIWTSQVGQLGYRKRDWQELQKLIFRKCGIEL